MTTTLRRLVVQLMHLLMGEMADRELKRLSNPSRDDTLAFEGFRDFLNALLGAMNNTDAACLSGYPLY